MEFSLNFPTLTSGVDIQTEVEIAVNEIRKQWQPTPTVAVILGTGLGAFVDGLNIDLVIPYSNLPGFCASTAIGHAGELVCGRVGETPILVLCGRTHSYEGVPLERMTFPVKVLKQLGVSTLLVSCAAGGLSPSFQAGEFMVIDDHIDFLLQLKSPLTSYSRSFTSTPYDEELNELICNIGREQNIPLNSGTYVSVTGPNYETRAEMRFYRRMADAIGMSTVPEVTLARQLGMRVCGLATITNLCNPDALAIADGEDVAKVASQTEPNFRRLVLELIRRISNVGQAPACLP